MLFVNINAFNDLVNYHKNNILYSYKCMQTSRCPFQKAYCIYYDMHIHVNSTCSYCQICLSKRKKRPKHRCCILLEVIKLYICICKYNKTNFRFMFHTSNRKREQKMQSFFAFFIFSNLVMFGVRFQTKGVVTVLSFYVAI